MGRNFNINVTVPAVRLLALSGAVVMTTMMLQSCGAGEAGMPGLERFKKSPSEETVTDRNVVTADNPMVEREIGDEKASFSLLSSDRLKEKVTAGSVLDSQSAAGQAALARMASEMVGQDGAGLSTSRPSGSGSTVMQDRPAAAAASLVLGFPKALLSTPYLFGGVITKISDHETQALGNLKLTDLPPFNVKPVLATVQGTSQTGFVLRGCSQNCTASSAADDLISFPITGVDEAAGKVMLNISDLGTGLDLISIIDPDGQFTGLKERSSRAVWADFSQNTLVFDVESTMAQTNAASPDVVVTVRWYLRPATVTHSGFAARAAADGVGFFGTSLASAEKITRFPKGAEGLSEVKYYLKNIPQEYQADFAAVFSNWNNSLRQWGVDLKLTYEIIPAGDARNDLIMTGDVRYNVIEWDIYNKATYGGLGPSIAQQLTGETISANVLIQGPEILKIYQKWFDASRTARDLRSRGLIARADAELMLAQTSIDQQMAGWQQNNKGQLRMHNAQGLTFRITSDLPQLSDNPRIEFDPWPAGVTFASYMSGYWLDTVGHEVGHNMGLRHNFRGSLGGVDRPMLGQVSRSIMEYLPITHRYLDFAGSYDQMALKYGYQGVTPTSRTWFCTDEGKAAADKPGNSAECTTDDANVDAFGYFEAKLNKAIDYLVAPGSADAPTWKLENMNGQVDKALNGLLSYANSAAQTSSGWTNWSTGHAERPTAPATIKTFVLGRVKGALCAARIDQAVAQKSTAAAKDVARANVSDLRSHAATLFATYHGVGNASAIGCPAR